MTRPRTPRNTTHSMSEDLGEKLLFLAAGMSEGGAATFIEEQEAVGQRELVQSDVIPALGYNDADLTALGFTLGDPVDGDPLFRHATLPEGWRREGTSHAMHSSILDTLGRKRAGMFYKAAFYDRRADLRITSIHNYLDECLYSKTDPILDRDWATKAIVIETLAEIRAGIEEQLEFWRGHNNEGYVADYSERLAACDALKAQIEAMPS